MVQSLPFESDWIPDGRTEENGSPQGNAQATEGSGWELYNHLQFSGYGNRKNGESQPEIRRTKCLVAVVSVHFCSWEKRGSETGMIIQRFF
jgi:hypothetical protein